MNQSPLFVRWKNILEENLAVLPDKSEENPDNTLRALWLAACGVNVSATQAAKHKLPELGATEEVILTDLIRRRLEGTPLAHLTGRQNFMGLELKSDPRALIPRRETELLGNTAIEICRSQFESDRNAKIIDLCCGSGNLGIVLAKQFENVQVYASDLSEEAVALSKENIEFTGVDNIRVYQSDLFSVFDNATFHESVDLIICNPPYISTAKVHKMENEIAGKEPLLAFDGGAIGLKIIQNLIKESPRFLTSHGWLAFEVGLGQGEFIMQLCEKNGSYGEISARKDANGNVRVIVARKK